MILLIILKIVSKIHPLVLFSIVTRQASIDLRLKILDPRVST